MVNTSIEEMSSVENPSSGSGDTPNLMAPQTPVLSVACRILRSPSHESVTTDLSLFSVSSVDSTGGRRLLNFTKCDRGHSPNPDSRSQSR